jgi:hypothetical protein
LFLRRLVVIYGHAGMLTWAAGSRLTPAVEQVLCVVVRWVCEGGSMFLHGGALGQAEIPNDRIATLDAWAPGSFSG